MSKWVNSCTCDICERSKVEEFRKEQIRKTVHVLSVVLIGIVALVAGALLLTWLAT